MLLDNGEAIKRNENVDEDEDKKLDFYSTGNHKSNNIIISTCLL